MIFVFGSNRSGIHGAGAAKYALNHHGAIWKNGEGRQGNSYAIPTKDHNIKTLSLTEIEKHISKFLKYATEHKDDIFLLTPIGTGLAGHKKSDIVKILKVHYVPKNVVLSREWITDYKDTGK